jgi:hypothetical protein
MSQHLELEERSRCIRSFAKKAQRANIAFSPKALIGVMADRVGLWPSSGPDQSARSAELLIRAVHRGAGDGRRRRLRLGATTRPRSG